MTIEHNEDRIGDEGRGLSRRTVLKSMATASVAGVVGIPGFSMGVAADHLSGHPTSEFELFGIDHGKSRLITISSGDLVPGTAETEISYIDLDLPSGYSSISLNTLAAHPFEEDAYLYGTNVSSNEAFTVNPTTGEVTFFGNSDPVLGGIAASAIIIDDDDNARWYGITHGGAGGNANKIWEIDLDTAAVSGGYQLTHDSENVTATHVGMGVNFLTDELWGVIADPNDSQDSNVFRVLDPNTGEIDIVNDSALTGGRSVGAAFGPCANIMFAMRQGSELYGYNVSDDAEHDYGTLVYSPGVPTDFDNLAVPYGFECAECNPCELEGPVKFEYDEETDTFILEGESSSGITFDSYESKEDEEFEPTTATFNTDYCEIYVLVKSGQEFEVQSPENLSSSVTVETANDGKYAISFVEFFCDAEAAEVAKNNFPSKGR